MRKKIITKSFVLSDVEIENANFNIVGKYKKRCNKELNAIVVAHQQRDTRSFCIQRTEWLEDKLMDGMRHYSRSACLFLNNRPCIYRHNNRFLPCAVHPTHKEQGLCNEECPDFAQKNL